MWERNGVRVEAEASVLSVTLCNPERRNAQTPATWRTLADVSDEVTDTTRVVLLQAEGASFSAGLDRAMMTPEGVPGEPSLLTLAQHEDAEMEGFITEAQRGFTWWSTSSSITMAVVQGHAIGAGMQLALACDLIVAADDAQFAMRETSLGLVPDLAGTSPLVARVGYARALEICATGRFVDAQEALTIGLVDRVFPRDQLGEYSRTFAQELQVGPPDAVRALKGLLRSAALNTPEQQQAAERRAQIGRLQDLARMLQQP
jgi:enoyl-CoA hydratase/carnithine racemase